MIFVCIDNCIIFIPIKQQQLYFSLYFSIENYLKYVTIFLSMEAFLEQKTRLLKELDHLEKSYKAGIVNEEEFLKGKDRIESKLRGLEKVQREKEEKAHIVQEILEKKSSPPMQKKSSGQHAEHHGKSHREDPPPEEKPKFIKAKRMMKARHHRSWPEPRTSSLTWYVALALLVLVGIFLISQWLAPSITIEYYFDVTCLHCKTLYATLKDLQDERSFDVVYKYYPLNDQGFRAAEAFECALNQGNDGHYLDLLFSSTKVDDETLKHMAQQLELNLDVFTSCLTTHATAQKIRMDVQEVQAKGVDRVPTLIINNQKIVGVRKKDALASVIDQLQ